MKELTINQNLSAEEKNNLYDLINGQIQHYVQLLCGPKTGYNFVNQTRNQDPELYESIIESVKKMYVKYTNLLYTVFGEVPNQGRAGQYAYVIASHNIDPNEFLFNQKELE